MRTTAMERKKECVWVVGWIGWNFYLFGILYLITEWCWCERVIEKLKNQNHTLQPMRPYLFIFTRGRKKRTINQTKKKSTDKLEATTISKMK